MSRMTMIVTVLLGLAIIFNGIADKAVQKNLQSQIDFLTQNQKKHVGVSERIINIVGDVNGKVEKLEWANKKNYIQNGR